MAPRARTLGPTEVVAVAGALTSLAPVSTASAPTPGPGRPRSALLAALVARPDLWPVALRTYRALLPRSWWARWPFLPVPARPYMAFRLETMYGSQEGPLGAADAVGYLEWCRRTRALAR
jgi:hypothetical protein